MYLLFFLHPCLYIIPTYLSHPPVPFLWNVFFFKCWGKGYYGATGHETWHSTGQIPNQMGNNLPTLDLGTFVSDSTSSTSSAPGRKLRGLGGVSRRSMQETGTGNTNYQVEYLAAGGQRSCAILDGGAVKVILGRDCDWLTPISSWIVIG